MLQGVAVFSISGGDEAVQGFVPEQGFGFEKLLPTKPHTPQ